MGSGEVARTQSANSVLAKFESNVEDVVSEMNQLGAKFEATAERIAESSIRCQKQRITVLASGVRRSKNSLPWTGILGNSSLYHIADEKVLSFNLDLPFSLHLEGHNNIRMEVEGRIAHLLMVDCSNLNLKIASSPLVGLYLIRCQNCSIEIGGNKALYSLGLETCQSVSLSHQINRELQITNYGSMSVSLNGTILSLNPFNSGSWIVSPAAPVEMVKIESSIPELSTVRIGKF